MRRGPISPPASSGPCRRAAPARRSRPRVGRIAGPAPDRGRARQPAGRRPCRRARRGATPARHPDSGARRAARRCRGRPRAGECGAGTGRPCGAAVPAAVRRRLIARQLVRSGLLDPAWYAATYPDVAHSGRAPPTMISQPGSAAATGRTRCSTPAGTSALRRRPPLRHEPAAALPAARLQGRPRSRPRLCDRLLSRRQSRRPANGMNPLAHYLRYGRHEGRLPVPPG